MLQRNVDAIRERAGVPHINHPNFQWAMTGQDLQQVRTIGSSRSSTGTRRSTSEGGGGVPGLEEVWDRILTSGTLLYGIAVDDAHVFKQPGNPQVAGPGRGWVMVRAARLETAALLQALERGNFYASTGVVLDDVEATATALTVRVKTESTSKYRIRFIGRGGQVLNEATEPTATYTFTGGEGYVRAKVLESNGRVAWVQPVQVVRKIFTRDRRGVDRLRGDGRAGADPGVGAHLRRCEIRRDVCLGVSADDRHLAIAARDEQKPGGVEELARRPAQLDGVARVCGDLRDARFGRVLQRDAPRRAGRCGL